MKRKKQGILLISRKSLKFCNIKKFMYFFIFFVKRKQIDKLKSEINKKINQKITTTVKQINK